MTNRPAEGRFRFFCRGHLATATTFMSSATLTVLPMKSRLLVGLTLFSMFFGAGNLIFPPFLGVEAGTHTWFAMAGFLLTAVGFPILGVIAVAESGGLDALARRVSPAFAFCFTLLIYISIGPALAIPRTASTSFEMVVRPIFDSAGLLESTVAGVPLLAGSQALYSVLFFLVAFFIALNPEKLTQRLGKCLSPLLILLILTLFVGVILNPIGDYGPVTGAYAEGAFARGFIEGYQTMDTIAALNFGLIIAMNIRAFGVTKESAVVAETVKAGLIALVVFLVVYGALAHVGAQTGGSFSGLENGAQTLTQAAAHLFGPAGAVVLGLIFFIACLNTCVGLLSCCSNYFRGLIPAPGYTGWVAIFAILSMIVSNAGLTLILKVSVPVLVAIYPLALVLIVLALFTFAVPRLGAMPKLYPVTMLVTGVVSVTLALEGCGLRVPGLSDVLALLPWAASGLGWVTPAAAAALLTILWGVATGKKPA